MIWKGSSIHSGMMFDKGSISGLRFGWNWIHKSKWAFTLNNTVPTSSAYNAPQCSEWCFFLRSYCLTVKGKAMPDIVNPSPILLSLLGAPRSTLDHHFHFGGGWGRGGGSTRRESSLSAMIHNTSYHWY